MKKLIRTLQNHFPSLGEWKNEVYHLLRSRLRLAHERDFALIALLPRREGDLFLDVGGNRGQSLLSIRKYRPDARIACFEPNPEMVAWLERHFLPDPELTLHPFGLGARRERLTLHAPSYRGFPYCGAVSLSPDHARHVFGPHTLYDYDPRHVSVREIACEIRALDELDLAPSFIKIDVEGFEHAVLKGGVETLRRHEPVLLFERSWTDPAVFGLLGELGYREARLRGGRLELGASEEENAIMMTARRLAECGISLPAERP